MVGTGWTNSYPRCMDSLRKCYSDREGCGFWAGVWQPMVLTVACPLILIRVLKTNQTRWEWLHDTFTQILHSQLPIHAPTNGCNNSFHSSTSQQNHLSHHHGHIGSALLTSQPSVYKTIYSCHAQYQLQYNSYSNVQHRLSTAHALDSFSIQERDHIYMLCLVAVKLQSPTTQLTPQQITTTALFTTFHVQGNPHVHMSNCQNGTRSRDDHGVIPVLFGWCFRVSFLHAVVYILKTFLLYTMLTFFLLFFS